MDDRRRDKKGRLLKTGESQRADGRYMYRYIDVCGERQTVYSWRLTESDSVPRGKKAEPSLREKELEIEKANSNYLLYNAGKMTLNELFEQYISLKLRTKKTRVKTVSNYRSVWNRNMRDRPCANMPLDQLRRNHFINLYQDMLDDGVGTGSITLLNKNIGAILNYAVDEGYIGRNYSKGCLKEVEVYTNKRDALSLTEQKILLEYIASNRIYQYGYWMVVFMIETALRCSEMAGMTWNDVDLKNGFVTVDHQLLYEYFELGSSRKRLQIVPPKTKSSIRRVPLSREAVHALREQKSYLFRIGKLQNYQIGEYRDFVFLTSRNTLWEVGKLDHWLHNVVDSYNEEEQEKAQKEKRKAKLLPRISAHVLRHTGCTRMAESGMDMKTVQRIMGHNSWQMTMNVYNHVDDNRMRREIEKLNQCNQKKSG